MSSAKAKAALERLYGKKKDTMPKANPVTPGGNPAKGVGKNPIHKCWANSIHNPSNKDLPTNFYSMSKADQDRWIAHRSREAAAKRKAQMTDEEYWTMVRERDDKAMKLKSVDHGAKNTHFFLGSRQSREVDGGNDPLNPTHKLDDKFKLQIDKKRGGRSRTPSSERAKSKDRRDSRERDSRDRRDSHHGKGGGDRLKSPDNSPSSHSSGGKEHGSSSGRKENDRKHSSGHSSTRKDDTRDYPPNANVRYGPTSSSRRVLDGPARSSRDDTSGRDDLSQSTNGVTTQSVTTNVASSSVNCSSVNSSGTTLGVDAVAMQNSILQTHMLTNMAMMAMAMKSMQQEMAMEASMGMNQAMDPSMNLNQASSSPQKSRSRSRERGGR